MSPVKPQTHLIDPVYTVVNGMVAEFTYNSLLKPSTKYLV